MAKVEAPTVLVDMDNVLADFDAEVTARLRANHPHIPIQNTRLNFYIADDYPEYAEIVKEISSTPGFSAALPLVEGALDGWGKIIEFGYHPRVCTAPITTDPANEAEKLGWLEEYFAPIYGSSVLDEAIVSSKKYLYDGVALLDDRPEVKNENEATWQHIVFDRPYNRVSDKPRLHGWPDPMLENLLAEASRLYRLLGRSAIDRTTE